MFRAYRVHSAQPFLFIGAAALNLNRVPSSIFSRCFDSFLRKSNKFRGRIVRVGATLPPKPPPPTKSSDVLGASDDGTNFLAPSSIALESLGLSERVVEALNTVGVARPSRIQATAIPELIQGQTECLSNVVSNQNVSFKLSFTTHPTNRTPLHPRTLPSPPPPGRNAVIASETGSGKTLAYLAPLLHQITQRHTGAAGGPSLRGLCQAVVLCPTNLIVQQVLDVVTALRDASGRPLASCEKLSAAAVPLAAPDIAVTTPPALLNFLLVTEVRAGGVIWI